MANIGLPPLSLSTSGFGQFLTFVVPAAGGCNLNCTFCFIRQRGEYFNECLRPCDIELFIREAAQSAPIFAISIQGFEPLLPELLQYSSAVLATGRQLGVPANLVTNGVYLRSSVPQLAELEPCTLGISLDSGTACVHDRMRGVEGCWAGAIDGIRQARRRLRKTELAVISVLMPSKVAYLRTLPRLLSELEIENWIVNPLVRLNRTGESPAASKPNALVQDLLILQEAAAKAGIRLRVSDEFGELSKNREAEQQESIEKLPLLSLPKRVEIFRLLPNGQCSAGRELLRRLSSSTPRWIPGKVHAGVFEQLSRSARAHANTLAA